MLARAAIAVAILALPLSEAVATGSGPRGRATSEGACSVPPLPAGVLRRGAASVRAFRRIEARERRADLMGFRGGPRLGPPSSAERARIAEARSLRRQFSLNPSTLLIRRLARDHSHRSQFSFLLPPLKVTALEERDLQFRDRVEIGLNEVDRYVAHCARRTYGGLYIDYRPWPAEYRVVVLFTGPLAPHRIALGTRARYHSLMPVRHARFSLRELLALQRRVDADVDEWRSQGFDINSTGIDEERNAVVATIGNPSARATAAFRRRYGSGVILEAGRIVATRTTRR